MMNLLMDLAKVNNFVTHKIKDNAYVRLTYTEEEEMALAENLDDYNEPMSYTEHTNWINFTKYDLPKPIYINLVRHPIRKTIQFNSQTATQIAKRNIEQDYAVVGTWEETNITLTVLEHYIPRFFKDATKIFYSDGNKYHKNATPHKTELEPEVELYTLKPLHLNNTAKAEKEWIFFNRLEKVGSQSMIVFLEALADANNFVAHIMKQNAYVRLTYTEEEEKAMAEDLDDVEEVMSYTEHTNWINFTKYDLPKPIYINLVRHPLRKTMSAYYYNRRPEVYEYYKKKYNRTMSAKEIRMSFNDCVKEGKRPDCKFDSKNPFNADWRRAALHFCGNKNVCKQFNSQTATQIAKRNIEQDYAVVGTWEETNITLSVLEHYIPRFFKDATKIFYSDVNRFPKHLNNTAKAEKDWIFFNRLEKVGSQSMIHLLQVLANANNFQALENREDAYIRFVYTEEEEQAIAEELDEVNEPMSYSEHTNWINFTQYDLPKPIYINLIRYPINRIMSAYYFKRRPDVYEFYKKKFNRTDYDESYFKTSFNDCVKQAKREECKFEADSRYNADWRKAAIHFCGNKPVCRYV
ncbi:uncharacterized protein LOC119615170 [Lucilia sericata]|uniref:uncharacterized protein LOC119615170 n=1 Tax=Lucilia sericata TaxID=13632 RepID=UPI0018A7EAF7|nr:uncharacterized protein LOC119615170 [Lucilia sericata]